MSNIIEWQGRTHFYRVRGFFNSTSSAGNFLGFCCVIWFYAEFIKKKTVFYFRTLISFILFPLTA